MGMRSGQNYGHISPRLVIGLILVSSWDVVGSGFDSVSGQPACLYNVLFIINYL